MTEHTRDHALCVEAVHVCRGRLHRSVRGCVFVGVRVGVCVCGVTEQSRNEEGERGRESKCVCVLWLRALPVA